MLSWEGSGWVPDRSVEEKAGGNIHQAVLAFPYAKLRSYMRAFFLVSLWEGQSVNLRDLCFMEHLDTFYDKPGLLGCLCSIFYRDCPTIK